MEAAPRSNTPARADTSTAPTATGNDTGYLRVFVFALFFFFGGITSLNDVIIPRLKELFTLSYAEVMTVQSAFFGAYFIISLPAAAVVRRIGYMRSAVVGLVLMMIGCLLFIPASSSAMFQMFLVALFIVKRRWAKPSGRRPVMGTASRVRRGSAPLAIKSTMALQVIRVSSSN